MARAISAAIWWRRVGSPGQKRGGELELSQPLMTPSGQPLDRHAGRIGGGHIAEDQAARPRSGRCRRTELGVIAADGAVRQRDLARMGDDNTPPSEFTAV